MVVGGHLYYRDTWYSSFLYMHLSHFLWTFRQSDSSFLKLSKLILAVACPNALQ